MPWSEEEEKRLTDEGLITWDQAREMRSAGMDIQSRTATHRILQTVSDDDLDRELALSKRALETELGESICSIAYPSGVGVGQHTKIGRAVRKAGYDIGFSGGGVCRLGKHTDPLDLRRISIDLSVPEAAYRAAVVVPYAGF